MLEWLKWKIAGREMAELERWRVEWHQARRWIGEFPDARDALDRLRQEVDGVVPFDISRLRDNMRARRDEQAETLRDQGANQMSTALRDVHGNLIARDIVEFFDQWENVLPAGARETLRSVVEKARAALKGAR